MKRWYFLLIPVLAVACGGVPQAAPTQIGLEGQTPTIVQPTATDPLPIPTITLAPLATETQTPAPAPCDPAESYCVEAGHFFLDRPIALPGTIMIDRGYPYGTTEGGTRDPHHGVEFNNATGTPVLAAADGRIVAAANDSQTIFAIYPNSYGNLVVIEHRFPGIPEPVYTVYGHLSRVEVQTGQTVHSGEEIAQVGATGAAIGSHLHFEVRLGQDNYDSNRNPVLWLKPLVDDAGGVTMGALTGRVENTLGELISTDALNIQYFADRNGTQTAAWPVETYVFTDHPVQSDDTWNENMAMSDLQPGDYRISLMWGGRLYERWVKVFPGELTFFVFQVD